MQWIVSKEQSGITLIAFLKSQLGETYSLRAIKRALESNCCEINGRIERFAATRLVAGEKVSFQPLPRSLKTPVFDPSRILYEDSSFLAYNKPPGITSDQSGIGSWFPGLVLIHRLDKDTSGVILFAKSDKVKQAMVDQFRKLVVEKTYLALVDGIPTKKEGFIENYLGKIQELHGQTVWGRVSADKGLFASTYWSLEKMGKEASLLKCFPKTGRTHQIRVHLSEMGHPILGDTLYGKKFHSQYRPNRCLLHALAISFTHPFEKKQVHIEAEVPEDFFLKT